ncbi:MAG: ABC transporter permease [Bacteroidetes bacterium]|nr:ABC transporter permease [Bacteroidota bacterium]
MKQTNSHIRIPYLNSQFIAFIRKEFYHVFRDKKTLLLLFGVPIVQILLFGFALTNEIKNANVIIIDYAKDNSSQNITDRFTASQQFKIKTADISHTEIENEFKKGDVKLALIFPLNFEQDLFHQNHAQVQIIADASDPNTATTLTFYASRIIMDYQMDLLNGRNIPMQIDIQQRMIYNPELKGTTNFVPGVMALVLLLICTLMTSVSIVKEKENGTMEILLVSPFNPVMVVIAKAIPYLILSLINLTVILLLSVLLLNMPINGSIPLLYFESTMLIITALSLGLLISNVTNSQQTAMLISLMAMLLPTMILTGFLFPIENMPWPLQVVSNILPSKWYYIIVKAIMIKGLGIAIVWKETLILFAMMMMLLFTSIKKFKTRLA